ncbi:MAG TPA: helix-turn-helix transcriptional regulator [Hyphomonadaceae bacterium]|nr:helix-turn-helix transcriptional regulator [Hyphomonadaceae bacterium]
MRKSVHSTRYRRLLQLIVEARLAAGLTQSEVAAKLRRSQSYVAKVEGSERRLDVLEFVDLAAAIGADPAQLLSVWVNASRR